MWCDDSMTRTARTRLALAIGGFVAFTIIVPFTVRGPLPGDGHRSSDTAQRADLGAALRIAVGSEVAAIVSQPGDRVWTYGSARTRVLPVGDVGLGALLRAAVAIALVVSAIVVLGTTRLAANTSDPRAPPLLLQPQ